MELIIKYFVETLNRENGGTLFEQVASTLAEKEICSNILPSTGPFGGGDMGIDLRTHKTYLESSNSFRLYNSTEKTPTKEKIIFAFSIEKDWKSKINNDCKKIIEKYKLKPTVIDFITNQFIKTKDRENKITELKKIYPKIDFEIFDGNWIFNQLKEKHYNILVRYFNFPETHDPKIEEVYQRIYSFRDSGMTDAESVKVKNLLQRISYRVSYNGIIEQRVIDLKTVADIQVKYLPFIEKSIKNYEEALTEIKEIKDKVLISNLYYCYFKALQKLRLFDRIGGKLPEYRDFLLKNKHYQDYGFIFTWLLYLFPHKNDISSLELKKFAKESFDLMEKDIPNQVAQHIMAYYEEALVLGKQLLTFLGESKEDLLKLWSNHIKSHKDIPLYPIGKISRIVTVLAIHYEGKAEYEDLYKFVENLLINRNQKFEVAQLRKDRAMNLFNAGLYDKAIRHLNIVKIQWYDYETLRGSLLTAWLLNECYVKLGLYYSALQELYGILHMTTLDENTLSKHKDLFVKSLVFIYFKYLQLGMLGSALAIGKMALFAIIKYDMEPNLEADTSFKEGFEKNTMLSLVSLKNKYGDYADRALLIIEKIAPDIALLYKMIFKFREEIRNGKYSNISSRDIREPLDESTIKQIRIFTYKDIECVVEFEPDFDSKRLVEHLLAYLQEIFVFFLEDRDLTWIENKLLLNIKLKQSMTNFKIVEKPNNDKVELDLLINTEIINKLFTSPFKLLFELEQTLFSYILLQCTIDKQSAIKIFMDKLNKKDFFKGLSGRVPYGYVMNTFFPKEDYKKLFV